MTTGDAIAAISSAVGPAARMIARASGPLSSQFHHDLIVGAEPPESNAASCCILRFKGLDITAWIYTFIAPRSATG